MVKVEICKEGEAITAFRVEGHTGYAESGQDIVCAGVSAISQTAWIGMMNLMDQKPVHQRTEGFFACSLPSGLSEEDEKTAQAILKTMELGLLEIENAYKEFIQLTIRRC